MRTLKFLFSKTLLSYFWQEVLVRYRFKYVLPKITETQLEGIRLDLSKLSLRVRNRLLMGIYEAHEKRMCHDFLSSERFGARDGGRDRLYRLFCRRRSDQETIPSARRTGYLAILRANYELNGLCPAGENLARLAPFEARWNLEVAPTSGKLNRWRGAGASAGNTVRGAVRRFSSMIRHVRHPFNVLIIDVEAPSS